MNEDLNVVIVESAGSSEPLFAGTGDALAYVPELRSAFADGSASFTQLFLARYARYPTRTTEPSRFPEHRAAVRYLYDEVLGLFERAHHRIGKRYWCSEMEAACVLTYKVFDSEAGAEFFAISNWEQDDGDFVEQALELDELSAATDFLPPGHARDQCRDAIYEAYSSALSALDNRRIEHLIDQSTELKLVRQQVEQARKLLKGAGQRYAQGQYLWGMTLAIMLLVGVAAVVGMFLFFVGERGVVSRLLTWTIFGAIGAFVSVLARIAAQDFTPNWEASTSELRVGGASRAVVGAVFGAAIPILVISGLASVTSDIKTDDDLRSRFFFIGLALAAGFSERWARDLVEKQPSVLGSKDKNGAKKDSSNAH